MKSFKIIFIVYILVSYLLLAVVLFITSSYTNNKQSTTEEVETINKKISRQDDISKQLYENEINSLKRDNEQLKRNLESIQQRLN